MLLSRRIVDMRVMLFLLYVCRFDFFFWSNIIIDFITREIKWLVIHSCKVVGCCASGWLSLSCSCLIHCANYRIQISKLLVNKDIKMNITYLPLVLILSSTLRHTIRNQYIFLIKFLTAKKEEKKQHNHQSSIVNVTVFCIGYKLCLDWVIPRKKKWRQQMISSLHRFWVKTILFYAKYLLYASTQFMGAKLLKTRRLFSITSPFQKQTTPTEVNKWTSEAYVCCGFWHFSESCLHKIIPSICVQNAYTSVRWIVN